MDITPQAPAEQSSKYLNAAVAITVALLATFMGICKVKDDNIVQAMQQAQADKLDHWGYYQARNIRQEIAEATITQLELSRATQATTPANTAAYDAAIAKYRKLAADQASKKEDMRLAALQDQKNYDALNFKDDQFDLSDHRPARRHRTHPALGPVLGSLGPHHLRRAHGLCRPHRPADSPGCVDTAAIVGRVGTMYLIAACAIFYWASGIFSI
jgi:Domain of unknown function (DUF4337)